MTTESEVQEVQLELIIEETTDHHLNDQDMMTMEDHQVLLMILINQLNHPLVCKEVIHLNHSGGHPRQGDKQRLQGFQARQDNSQDKYRTMTLPNAGIKRCVT